PGHPRPAGGLRGPRLHGLSDVARAGNRRKTLLARGHHRQGKAGRAGVTGSHSPRQLPRRAVPRESGGRRGGGPEAPLARGGDAVNGQHLRAFFWLHWRLRVNQLKRGGVANAVILALLAVAVVLLAVFLFVASLLAGWLALARVSPPVLLYVW